MEGEASADARVAGLELSVVMPCLDEAETLEICIKKALRYLDENGIAGEIIIADNGSTDGSPELAERLGARVVHIERRGYGSALRGGIEAARGRYIIMGDSDDSYDFSNLHPFVEELRQGTDLVMGNRFAGEIRPGAMPWLHRWIGNPILTAVGRLFFHSASGDFHCGLRGFSKQAYERMRLRSTGMEFASEMVIKSTLNGLSISEIPIVLHPDGRSTAPHLRSWRDGWRHLRFMLLFSPLWLFMIPGLLLFAMGFVVSVVLSFGTMQLGAVEFDIHTLFAAGMCCLLGYQLIIFAIVTKTFAVSEGLHPAPASFDWIVRSARLEAGLLVGVAMSLISLGAIAMAVWSWGQVDFGGLDPRVTMRQLVPGGIGLVLGIQTIYASFLLSVLGLERD